MPSSSPSQAPSIVPSSNLQRSDGDVLGTDESIELGVTTGASVGADAEQESNESSINLSRLAAPPFPIQLIQQQQCHRLPIELSSVLPHHQVLIQLSPFFSPSESLLMSCSINVSLTSSLQSVFVIAAADGASVQTTHRAAQEAGSLHLSPAGNRGPSRRVSPLPGPDRVRRLSRLGSPWLGRPASPLSSPELVRRPSRADSPLLDLLVHPQGSPDLFRRLSQPDSPELIRRPSRADSHAQPSTQLIARPTAQPPSQLDALFY